MLDHNMMRLLAEEVNGDNALLHTREITHYHRSLGSAEYRAASQYVLNYWQRVGVATTVVEAPLDNETMLGNTRTPFAWEPHDAVLKVISPEERTVVDFKQTPTCINSWSQATPPDGIIAELVYVGDGDADADYEGKDVRGKVVLVDKGYTWRTQSLAMEKYGALGFVTDDIQEIPYAKTREMFPDFVLWNTLYERNGVDGGPVTGWALCISPRMGDYLRRLLQRGSVRVHARVNAETFRGVMENPMGVIEGDTYPQEEVLLTAHLGHTRPGGLDNAAGCAGHMEVLRAIAAAIDRGDVPRPRRSIKALFGPEGHQVNAYFYPQSDSLDNIIVAFGPCGGADPEEIKGIGVLGTSSVALPTFANDLCQDVLAHVNDYFPAPGPKAQHPFGFIVRRTSYSGDSMAINAWNVPCIDMNYSGNIYWHSQFDTVDKASAESFSKFAWAYAVVALTIANAGFVETLAIMQRVLAHSQMRLARVAASAREEALSATEKELPAILRRRLDELHYSVERDSQAIRSSLILVRHEDDATQVQATKECAALIEQLEEQRSVHEEALLSFARLVAGREIRPQEPETLPPEAALRPRLRRRGWMDIKHISREMGPKYEQWRPGVLNQLGLIRTVYEAGSLCDGQRTVGDITRILNHEYEPPLGIEVVTEIFRDLAGMGYVTL